MVLAPLTKTWMAFVMTKTTVWASLMLAESATVQASLMVGCYDIHGYCDCDFNLLDALVFAADLVKLTPMPMASVMT